jgi:hypothetical protein
MARLASELGSETGFPKQHHTPEASTRRGKCWPKIKP